MEKKRSLILAMAVVAIALIFAAFIVGRQLGSYKATAEYQAEREKYILWNRSDLHTLRGMDETIYVTGHKSPDSDTVCSSIAYARLLQKLGYNAQAVVLGEINNETGFILKTAGAEEPPFLEDASGKTMVLVDHSDYQQSADGLQDADIITIIDHHGDGTVRTGNQLVYDARPYGSTATIIRTRYYNYGVEIDPQIAFLMAGAILSDTKNLKSENTTDADRGVLKELTELADIKDIDALYQEMYKASISYGGKSDREVFFSDYKEYESGGKRFSIGCVEAYDEEQAKILAERMKKVFSEVLPFVDVDVVIAQISVFHDDLSINYLVPANEAAEEVLKTAFEGRAEFDGTAYILKPGISRRNVLVPAISDVLASYPKE